jgi:tRNA pseudouridine55 synthase
MRLAPGFIIVDKPAGVTSHDVVAAVRSVTGVRKVGHTGTLDPFATGVLPLALGGATRLIEYLDESIKIYDVTIALGAATDTGDPTGEVVREAPVPELDADGVRSVLAEFLGERMQEPPAYSAVKVDGKPLYHYARRGEVKRAKPRPITIHDLELRSVDGASMDVVITCSRGTYARVLADEIATALGTAGHLSRLMRTRSGPFYLNDAVSIERLSEIVSAEPERTWRQVLMHRGPREERVKWRPRDDVAADLSPNVRRPIDALTHLPLADVLPGDARRIRNGGNPPVPPGNMPIGSRYLVVCGSEVVAVAEKSARGPKTLKVVKA